MFSVIVIVIDEILSKVIVIDPNSLLLFCYIFWLCFKLTKNIRFVCRLFQCIDNG